MGQIQLDSDTFNGTDGTVLPTYNSKWVTVDTVHFNDCSIQGTPGVFGFAAADYNTGATWTNDQWAQITVDSTTLADSVLFLLLRNKSDNTESFYAAGFANAINLNYKYSLFRYDGVGSVNPLGSQSATVAALGDVVNFQAVGTVLTLRVNGNVDLTYDTSGDATKYMTGNPGIYLWHSANTRLAGSWLAGSITTITNILSHQDSLGLGAESLTLTASTLQRGRRRIRSLITRH